MLHEPADDVERHERGVLRALYVRIIIGVVGGAPIGTLLIVPGFVDGFRRSSPPVVANNIDAFLAPLCTWIVAAALVGVVVSASERVRASTQETQRKAARFCVLLGLVLALALYAIVAFGLPMVSRHWEFPSGVPADRALEVHPFMLTTPELFDVQATFRRVGGFSKRVALTQELRLWLSVTIPTLASLAVVGMLISRPRSRTVRVLAVELIALCFLFVGVVMTLGPAVFLRPSRGPFNVAWIIVTLTAAGSFWWLRRRSVTATTASGLGEFQRRAPPSPPTTHQSATDGGTTM
jgi:hypothetical protein